MFLRFYITRNLVQFIEGKYWQIVEIHETFEEEDEREFGDWERDWGVDEDEHV